MLTSQLSFGCLDCCNNAFEIRERVNTSLCKESEQSEEVTLTSLGTKCMLQQQPSVKMKTIARVLFICICLITAELLPMAHILSEAFLSLLNLPRSRAKSSKTNKVPFSGVLTPV